MEFIIRDWKISDIVDVAYFANNINIACNLRNVFPHPYTLKDAEEFVAFCIGDGNKNQLSKAIEIDGRVTGSISVTFGEDVFSKNGEIGYWLAEDYWNKGIMSKAIMQICDEVFRKYDIIRIFATPFASNIGSRKALEKAGFELEGIMKNGICKNNIISDYCMYALLKNIEPEIV